MNQRAVSTAVFYETYHGHELAYLSSVHTHLTQVCHKNRIVWLCGDSSLDSKFWFTDGMPAAGGYETLLSPPVAKQDLAAHLNALLHSSSVSCINTAVEESTLGERASGLLPHDQFIADHMGANDIVVVSVGCERQLSFE
jgi:hypothetical protein